MKNYAPFNNTPDAVPSLITPDNPQNQNIYSAMGTETKLKSTPSFFGGASVNYLITPKLNANLNAYYYSAQTSYHLSTVIFRDGVRGVDHINAKLLLNANVSYEAVKGFHIFAGGKNLLNNKSREFYHTDEVPFQLLAGLNYEF